MANQTTRISLKGCAKTFADGTQALEPIDMEIEGGETVAFLGPSGCGKTTLLRIIAGLETPDRGGAVLFNGEDVTNLPIEKRNVGMVFQSYALFPNMRVWENVAYGLKVRKKPKAEIEKTVGEMLKMMHITELADRRIDQLSGGQRQRVALARAIAVAPRILLLDEPLTALDAMLRERLRVEIDDLLRSLGITAVYVTHDQSEAMALGDRIVVMSKGRIAQIGSPQDVYYTPANGFVADFVGTINRVAVASIAGHAGRGEIVFRPEDAVIATVEPVHFHAEVKSALFLGDRTRLVLKAEGADDVILDTPLRNTFAAGERLPIHIRPEGFLTISDTRA